MTAKRTLKRDTLKALERAAMRWFLYPSHTSFNSHSCKRCKAKRSFWRACAAHARALKAKKKLKNPMKATRSPYDANGLKEYPGD